MRMIVLITALLFGTVLGALPTGAWNITSFFLLDIDPETKAVTSHEVNPAVNQLFVMNGRELQLTPISPTSLPYSIRSELTFDFRIGNRNYRASFLDTILYVHSLDYGSGRRVTGRGYWVFYLEPLNK